MKRPGDLVCFNAPTVGALLYADQKWSSSGFMCLKTGMMLVIQEDVELPSAAYNPNLVSKMPHPNGSPRKMCMVLCHDGVGWVFTKNLRSA